MFAEDRFGRRLRKEREDRGMTQADVARVLAVEHDLKLHATAIAKMEQRDVERPRLIRLSEARAIADMFGLTLDEMTSAADEEITAVAREFAHLGKQADALRLQTEAAMDRLRSVTAVMAVPEEQLTPAIRQARKQIIASLSDLQGEHRRRVDAGHQFIQDLRKMNMQQYEREVQVGEPGDLRTLQLKAHRAIWIRALRRLYPHVRRESLIEAIRADKLDVNTRLAAMLEPPNGSGPNWAMAAVFAHGLWGHGAAVELDERIARAMKKNPDASIKYTRQAELADMALEMQAEMDEQWSTVEELNLEVQEIWGSPTALEAWIEETDAMPTEGEGD